MEAGDTVHQPTKGKGAHVRRKRERSKGKLRKRGLSGVKKHRKRSPASSLRGSAWRSPAGEDRQVLLRPSRTPAEETLHEEPVEQASVNLVAVERPVVFQVPVESLRPLILNPNLELGEGTGSLPATPGK